MSAPLLNPTKDVSEEEEEKEAQLWTVQEKIH